MPLCILTGTYRFMPYCDFPAQFYQGLLIEAMCVTLPYLALVCIYMANHPGFFLWGTLGIVVHLVNFVFIVCHVYETQNNEEKRCLLVDPRTCSKVRDTAFYFCCKCF